MSQQFAGSSIGPEGAKESVGLFAWGMFSLLMIPVFDIVDPQVWGWVVIGVAVAGFIATLLYYASRPLQSVRGYSSAVMWPVWTVYSIGLGVAAETFAGHLPFAYTLAGVLSALPLLVIGARIRRREKA